MPSRNYNIHSDMELKRLETVSSIRRATRCADYDSTRESRFNCARGLRAPRGHGITKKSFVNGESSGVMERGTEGTSL